MISTLVSIPYEIARLPLALVDSQLSDKLPETSTPRVTLDKALGSADRIAGRLTGNRTIAARGAERLDRLDKLVTAERLEKDAAAKRDRADETFREGRQEAAQKRSRRRPGSPRRLGRRKRRRFAASRRPSWRRARPRRPRSGPRTSVPSRSSSPPSSRRSVGWPLPRPGRRRLSARRRPRPTRLARPSRPPPSRARTRAAQRPDRGQEAGAQAGLTARSGPRGPTVTSGLRATARESPRRRPWASSA